MLRNADGGVGCQIFRKKALRRCKVQCYLCYEGVGGGSNFQKKALRRCKVQCYLCYEGVGGGTISRKKRYVTLEWPLILILPKNNIPIGDHSSAKLHEVGQWVYRQSLQEGVRSSFIS